MFGRVLNTPLLFNTEIFVSASYAKKRKIIFEKLVNKIRESVSLLFVKAFHKESVSNKNDETISGSQEFGEMFNEYFSWKV